MRIPAQTANGSWSGRGIVTGRARICPLDERVTSPWVICVGCEGRKMGSPVRRWRS